MSGGDGGSKKSASNGPLMTITAATFDVISGYACCICVCDQKLKLLLEY